LKNAAELESYSKNSLLDEPELSFVSVKTNSNINSPMKEPISTPAFTNNNKNHQTNINQNFAAYLLHKNELFKRFSNISPIEISQQQQMHSLQSSHESSSLKSLKNDPTAATPVTTDGKNQFRILKKTDMPQFLTLTAEKTSMFTNETTSFEVSKQNKQNYESYLSTGAIEESKFHSSIINQSNFKSLSPTKSDDDMQMTIQYDHEHIINEDSSNGKHSSIIELSQIENLLNCDRNLLQTPASYFNEETLSFNAENHGISESLLSFERHEKSVGESSSTKKSPFLIEEETLTDDSFRNGKFLNKIPLIKSSKSPVGNKMKNKTDYYQNLKQPKNFRSQQFAPKTSELSPCLQKTLKNSFENSKGYNKSLTIDDSSVTQVTLLNNQNFDMTVSIFLFVTLDIT
jgi:hypothetical protein